ncbi:porin [Ralstonia flaminis]|jgi:predicted porin|uniref:Outer membrane porin protein 32 n=1 Tax=Ralstonia flaminis TaxID=3058597 RepID=A0ABN9JFU2_9RALS|nr:porin [Ralstonia sp. LMG 18101]CAJ0808017.1 Outer membrane porin protein 32 [Ralstonia sp. LMG 18101]
MLKKICWIAATIAAMAIGAQAHAQSSVQLYGIVDTWVGVQRYPGKSAVWQEGGGGMSTSFWGFGGKEDLGAGYKAIFAIEGFFRPQNGASGSFNGDPMFSRNAYVGLSTPAGTITLGRQSSLLYLQACQFNPFYASFTFSPTIVQMYAGLGTYPAYKTDQGIIGGTAWSNAVQYATPELHGLTGRAMYAFGESGTGNGSKQYSAQLSYQNGGFAAGGVYQYANFNSAAGDLNGLISGLHSQSAAQLAASYEWSVAKFYGEYTYTNNNVINKNFHVSMFEGGVTIALGTGKVLAAYAYSRDSGGLNQTRRTASLGYDYPLSKRTDLYAVYMLDRFSGMSSGETAGVGIRARF